MSETSAIVAAAGGLMRRAGYEPAGFQVEAWRAYAEGRSGLVHAPTGTGKTLAVWLGAVAEGVLEGRKAEGGRGQGTAGKSEPLRALWVTPLKALANDTLRSLVRPMEAAGLVGEGGWTAELRTGDVSSSVKKRQRARLPTVLVTTPESLTLLLSYPHARELFATLRLVVVDEWHELMGSKRGTQTELALARLRGWGAQRGRRLRTWGLSATLGNIDRAARCLVGVDRAGRARPHRVVRGPSEKAVRLDILLPESIDRFPWAGHMGLTMVGQVVDRIRSARTSLVFTNTRAQCERWFEAIVKFDPSLIGSVAIHHGSLEKALRERVEAMLSAGELSAVVCTSSLDLGVDFPTVDRVMQLGSPKGVGRLIQRAGRSGHRPGGVSEVVCVASHAFELVEFSAARAALDKGQVEPREPLDCPLDVLAQHVVTCAAGGGFVGEKLFDEVRTAASYAGLTEEQWGWVMDFASKGGAALGAYPEYQRIKAQGGRWGVATPQIERTHRMTIGTITGDAVVTLAYGGGRRLGTIEESFIARLRPGDRFVFAGRLLEFVRLREMTAQVKPAKGKKGAVPRWAGTRFPLSTRLADSVLGRFGEFDRGEVADEAMAMMSPVLELQRSVSRLPRHGELLIERVRLRDGDHFYLYPFLGRLVHEGLGALISHRLTSSAELSLVVNVNDYGIELSCPEPMDLADDEWRAVLDEAELLEDLLACMNTTVLARRAFREVARVAGLVVPGFPGMQKSGRHLQASSEMFFDVLTEFDPENLLLRQAEREVLERQLEVERLRGAMRTLAERPLVRVELDRLTPLSFPLWADRLRAEAISSESWEARVRRAAAELEEL
ncbi:MAG: ligase-associated DNA damage response DEXH box helicase [Planctomycetota bacterium]